MHALAATCPILALLAAAAAQAPLDLPVGTAGGAAFFQPFSSPSLRVQSVYPLLGSSPRVFRQLGLRREGTLPNTVLNSPQSQDAGEGRGFDLRIVLAQGNATAFGTNLAANYAGPPTTVFRGVVSLPAAKDQPKHPMPWSGAYGFPFATSYVHLGTTDLLVDLAVDQGALANGQPWLLTSVYLMDGWQRRETEVAWADYYSKPGCAMTLLVGGSTGKTAYSVPSAAYLGVMSAPANTGFVVGLGAQGVRQPAQGVPIASSCQPLMMLPLVTLPATTDAAGRFDIFLYRGPHLPALTGVPVFCQAAHTDPLSRSLQLTNAAELRMPDQPDPTVRARTKFASPASSSTALPMLVSDVMGLSIRMQ